MGGRWVPGVSGLLCGPGVPGALCGGTCGCPTGCCPSSGCPTGWPCCGPSPVPCLGPCLGCCEAPRGGLCKACPGFGLCGDFLTLRLNRRRRYCAGSTTRSAE